jgi:hypothetical protein
MVRVCTYRSRTMRSASATCAPKQSEGCTRMLPSATAAANATAAAVLSVLLLLLPLVMVEVLLRLLRAVAAVVCSSAGSTCRTSLMTS